MDPGVNAVDPGVNGSDLQRIRLGTIRACDLMLSFQIGYGAHTQM